MRLDLADRIDRDVHDDQQAGSAQEQRNARLRDAPFRQDAHKGQVDRADHGNARQHVIEIIGGALARTDARNEAALLLQVLGRILRIENDGSVEEAEEDDARRIQAHIERLAMLEILVERLDHRVGGGIGGDRIARELADRERQQQQ